MGGPRQKEGWEESLTIATHIKNKEISFLSL